MPSSVSNDTVTIPTRTLVELYTLLSRMYEVVNDSTKMRIDVVANKNRVEEILQEVAPGLLLRMQASMRENGS